MKIEDWLIQEPDPQKVYKAMRKATVREASNSRDKPKHSPEM